MSFFQPSPRLGSVIAVGKIPTHPEFLHAPTVREPAQSFDAWLEAGMELAAHRYGHAWSGSFEAGAVQGFVWRAPSGARCETLLCGVLFPSHDAIDRHFPLAAVCELPARVVLRAPHVLPLALGDFLERVHDACADFARLSPGDLGARLSAVEPPHEDELTRAAAEYEAWCASTRADSGWLTVFEQHPIESALSVIEALRAVTEPVRGVEAPISGSCVRLPLGRGGVGSAALWFDVVRRLCRWKANVPSAFWTIERGALVICLGDAPPGALASLWISEQGDDVYDLTVPWAWAGPPSRAQAPTSPAGSRADPPASTRLGATPPFDSPMSEMLGVLAR